MSEMNCSEIEKRYEREHTGMSIHYQDLAKQKLYNLIQFYFFFSQHKCDK